MDYTVTHTPSSTTWWIEFNEPTANNEKLVVELTRCSADPKDKKALPYIAKKHGWSDKLLSSWWGVQTYTTDPDGNRWGEKYNPTNKRESYEFLGAGLKPETRYRYTTDFEWWLEATEDNARKIISEIERRAFQRV